MNLASEQSGAICKLGFSREGLLRLFRDPHDRPISTDLGRPPPPHAVRVDASGPFEPDASIHRPGLPNRIAGVGRVAWGLGGGQKSAGVAIIANGFFDHAGFDLGFAGFNVIADHDGGFA